jgi:demethoxyubiquinone hydroxylase (CLK1/Coq7/Cat5 family)
MEARAGYEEGHLVVAAVRVLSHRSAGRPPTVEEVAELIKLSREWVGVLVAALERAEVVRAVTGPFETRVEVHHHQNLENLPRKDSTAGVDEELKEFAAKRRQEEEKLRGLFSSGKALKDQEKKMGDLADELKRYKPKGPKSSPLFKDPPPDRD